MKILGKEIETDFDYNDADDLERLEKAKKETQEKLENINEEKADSQIIRESCQSIFMFFDEVLGEGTHKEIFGNKCNIAKCMDAFINFIEEVSEQSNATLKKAEEFQAKYSPNRATRRAKK